MMNLQSKYWTWTTGSYNTGPSAHPLLEATDNLHPAQEFLNPSVQGMPGPSSSSSVKTPRTTHQQSSRPLSKTKRARTHRARFCQGFSNHHGQILAISPFAAYSPLALAVTDCASTPTLLLYSIHWLQPHFYIVHWNKNCSNCAFLYNCKMLDPPTREAVTQHTSFGSVVQNFQVPSSSM